LYIIENLIFYSLLTWSIILLLDKWGIRDELSGRAPNSLIQKAIECNFCFAHHVCFVLIIPQIFFDFEMSILFVPLLSATTVQKCLN